VTNQFFSPAAIITDQIVGRSVGFEQFVGCRAPSSRIFPREFGWREAQVEARYPGAYNITLSQLPTSAKKKRE
jgi:hypothetical protein